MTMLRMPPQHRPMQPSPSFPPACAIFNEDSPMQLKSLASCCYCMTNRTTLIPHGLSGFFQLHKAREMKKYTRVPKRQRERIECACVGECVCRRAPPHTSTGNGKGQRGKSMTKEHEAQAYKMVWTICHKPYEVLCLSSETQESVFQPLNDSWNDSNAASW